ncbi:MAG: energy transducer TonB [Terriglobales bacterium]|jgi:TonB family protein
MDEFGSPLTLLPERKMDWRSLVTSYGLQALAVLFLVNIGILLPSTIKLVNPSVAEVIQLMDVPKPQRPAVRPPKELMPPPPKVETPQIEEPKLVADLKIVKPMKQIKPVPELDTKAPEVKAPDVSKVLPSNPDEGKVKIVHTNTAMSTGSQATPTIAQRPASQVQTGGFGDPFGIKGVGKAGAHLVVSQGGAGSSFDLPVGPGYGNGSGGKNGAKGIIPSTGFGNGIATGNSNSNGGGGGGKKVVVADSGLNQKVVEAKKVAAVEEAPKTTPVKIISKPNPVYTDEARQLKLEGDVTLQVAFLANGECQVLKVVRGLGHGLDEAATRAAQQIKFSPATANGQPVDQTATIHVVFQLAY